MEGKLGILVVDDVVVNVTLITCMLKRFPYDIYVAHSGQEALDIIAENKIDLVLLDIMMPEMDGYEVLSRIRNNEQTKDLPVIVLSALTMSDDVQKAMDLGANGYLPKPILMPKLLEMVKKSI